MGIDVNQIKREDAIDILKMWKNPSRRHILVDAGVVEKDIKELGKIFKLK